MFFETKYNIFVDFSTFTKLRNEDEQKRGDFLLKIANFFDMPIPISIKSELFAMSSVRKNKLSELHLRAGGRSTAAFSGEVVRFSASPTGEELSDVLRAMCNGALYTFRESISRGYITLDGGVRVGICADARYDGGELVGMGDPTSLVYRIPTCDLSNNTDELYSVWLETKYGMLIYSPPGVGKTTALRSLAKRIGEGADFLNVAVIDERREFSCVDFSSAAVDVFSGYKRCDGLEIALRAASADVMVIDEIGGRGEAEKMLDFLNSGVRIIASAHAGSEEELLKRSSLRPFFEHGIFDTLAGISFSDNKCDPTGRVVKITRF